MNYFSRKNGFFKLSDKCFLIAKDIGKLFFHAVFAFIESYINKKLNMRCSHRVFMLSSTTGKIEQSVQVFKYSDQLFFCSTNDKTND